MDQDTEAIARIRKGEFEAFEALVEKYQGRIFRHLRKLVRDTSQAEDLLQETFLNAYRGLKDFSGTSSFSTWLFRIATNTALMFLRKHRPETVEYDDHIGVQTNSSPVPTSAEFMSTTLEILLSDEGRKMIEEAIGNLPVMYRSVIVLRDVEGFSLQEVSEIMDSSLAAVKSRLHRARNSVREALTAYYVDKNLPAAGRALR